MTELLATADLLLKVLIGIVGLGTVVFAAGKAWAGFSKVAGSQEALHRRLTEIEQKSELRHAALEATIVSMRIDLAKFQTWRSTLRFRPPSESPQPAPAEQDMFVVE